MIFNHSIMLEAFFLLIIKLKFLNKSKYYIFFFITREQITYKKYQLS